MQAGRDSGCNQVSGAEQRNRWQKDQRAPGANEDFFGLIFFF